MLVTTTPSVEGSEISSYLGVVIGSTVRARHLGTDILATLKSLIGGELKSYSILLTAARKEAMDRMIASAKEKQADAIINFRYDGDNLNFIDYLTLEYLHPIHWHYL